ncbi:MAG: sterol carrier family protein [Actinomycetota bacterium]|nr:sterol carrier family protein [Actinomycetota bacterium]
MSAPYRNFSASQMTAAPSSITEVLAVFARGEEPSAALVKAAVKESLAVLIAVAPGRSVEVRIPPYAAVQAIPGRTHRRGTPSAVVETDARTWLELCIGLLEWTQVTNRVRASGERSDLSAWLPLFDG